jgi:hypothetical protein
VSEELGLSLGEFGKVDRWERKHECGPRDHACIGAEVNARRYKRCHTGAKCQFWDPQLSREKGAKTKVARSSLTVDVLMACWLRFNDCQAIEGSGRGWHTGNRRERRATVTWLAYKEAAARVYICQRYSYCCTHPPFRPSPTH